jgi:hypothetical protein
MGGRENILESERGLGLNMSAYRFKKKECLRKQSAVKS